MSSLQPYQLLDDGFAPEPCDVVVIGCGNILRGDDAVGPTLIRHLHLRGFPDGVRLVDGGTAGMDVAFAMRGAQRVVIVDAATTGNSPGTIYRVPGEQLAELPPIDGLHTHNFRWDHALSFSTWLLGPQRPTDVTVFLIEAGSTQPGESLSEPVAVALQQVADLVVRDFYPAPAPPAATVELTAAGYLHLTGEQAATWFPADLCVARTDGDDLVLMPLRGAANGGLVLKQRTPAGDRSLLIHEVLGFRSGPGVFPVTWDAGAGQLRIHLGSPAPGRYDGERAAAGRDGGGGRTRPVGGVPGDDPADGTGTQIDGDLSDPGLGAPGRRRGPASGGPAPAVPGGSR